MHKSRSITCKGCWCQMHVLMPIRGPLSIPFRLVGIKPSRMNPNICNMCESKFSRVRGARQIVVPVSILFADIRGYTTVSELSDFPQIAHLLSDFYENCASVIWERDGIINKLIGDAILAIFNFPITLSDHTKQAVLAGLDLQKKCLERRLLIEGAEQQQISMGVGVGIHTGNVSIGEIGEFCKDFTAIGEVVNVASRLQGAAKPEEVLVTEDVYRQIEDLFPRAESRAYQLKGIQKPVNAYALCV